MAGLTAAGMTVLSLAEILDEIATTEKNTIHPSIDTSSSRPLGQLNGVFSEREALLWELLQLAYGQFDPDVAEGYLLDALCLLTGVLRRPASASRVACTVNLDAGVTLPQGSTAHVLDQPLRLFASTADVTATAAGDYDVIFEAAETGPIPANAGTLTVIAGPVTGWNSVTNAEDAAEGRDIDTDAQLRARREDALQRAGGATPDAIRSDLLAIDGITKVVVFENNTDEVVDTLPAHSIEIMVFDGLVPSVDNDTIAQAIWDTRAPVRLAGSDSGTATDSEGEDHVIPFSRPTLKDVYISATVTTVGDTPEDPASLLRDALVLTGNLTLSTGVDVVALRMKDILLNAFSWVYDVPTLTLGFTASPVGTANLAISDRELAQLDTSRVVITIA